QKYRELLKGTTFIDKVTMLSKLGLLSEVSNSDLKSTFALAEQVRNLCAHGGTRAISLSLCRKANSPASYIGRSNSLKRCSVQPRLGPEASSRDRGRVCGMLGGGIGTGRASGQ